MSAWLLWSSTTLGKIPYTADFLKKLTSIYVSSLANLKLSSSKNYTYDLSEYACSYSVDLPTGDNSNWFTYDQLCSLLDFGQQIWDNEFASNFSDVITILDNWLEKMH